MKVIKGIRYATICILILLCEMTFGTYIEVSGAVPMLSFCLCIVVALFEDDMNFITGVAAVTGGIVDVLTGYGFGTYTFTFTLSALITFYIRDRLFSSKVLFMIIDVFVLSVFTNIIYYLLHMKDIGNSFGSLFVSIMLPSAIYNVFVSLIFYPILKLTMYKRR